MTPSTSLRCAGMPALLLALSTGPARAQALLYTLTSPNEETDGAFGKEVAWVSDLDGDGRSDVLVSDNGEGPGYAGRAYVFSGATGDLLYTLDSPNEEASGAFGGSLSGVPDVDGDGRGDLLIAASGEDLGSSLPNAGRAYVFSGGSGMLLYELTSPNAEEDGSFGVDVAGVQDVDGDGAGDLLISATGEGPYDSGPVYVFNGKSGALLYAIASPIVDYETHFGSAVSGVGDVDGDGSGDLLVGAYNEDFNGLNNLGRAYLFSGATGALLYALASPNEEEGGKFGIAVAGVSDVDGDGREDLLVGADEDGDPVFGLNIGRAYVFSGRSGTLLHTLESPLGHPNGYFGDAVSGVTDVDGDGRGDLLVGAFGEPPSEFPPYHGPGRAYVFSGATGALLAELTSPDEEEDGHFGESVSGGPDVDGDGRGDIIVGARLEDGGPLLRYYGRAYVFSGGAAGTAIEPAAPSVLLLLAPRPNPFADRTTLAFALPAAASVRLSVYDVLGREVALLVDREMPAGQHEAVLDASRLPSGTYLVRLEDGGEVRTQRVTLVR